MKIRIAFAAIALFAIASAFTTRNRTNLKFQYSSEDATYYYAVNDNPQTQGTGSGQYTCETPTTVDCVINTVDVFPDADNNFRILKSQATKTAGTFTLHP